MSDVNDMISEIVDIINAENVLNDNFILKLQTDFEYEGFKAENILKKVLLYIKKDPAVNGKNVLKLIAIGLFRGNNLKSIKESLKKEQAMWFGKIVANLSIYSNVEDGPSHSKSEKITLSRLRMALPQLAFKVLKHEEFKRPITSNNIQQVIPGFSRLVPFARDMCIMSLLPREAGSTYTEEDHEIMVSQIFIYCFCETEILIKQGDRPATKSERANRVKKYMQISWNADHIKNDLRNLVAKDIHDILNKDTSELSDLEDTASEIFDYTSALGIDLENAFNISRD